MQMSGTSTPGNNSASPTAPGTRQGSLAGPGGIKHTAPRPRQNVKFSVGNDEDTLAPPRQNSAPELLLLEPTHVSAVHLAPAVRPDLEHWSWRPDAQTRDSAAQNAYDRASRHADKVKKRNSAPTSRRNSFDVSPGALPDSTYLLPTRQPPVDHPSHVEDIPMGDIEKPKTKKPEPLDEMTDSDEDELHMYPTKTGPRTGKTSKLADSDSLEKKYITDAKKLVRSLSGAHGLIFPPSGHRSGSATPLIDQNSHEFEYVPRPTSYKPSVLQILLGGMGTNASHESKEKEQYLSSQLALFSDPATDPRKHQPDFFTRARQKAKSYSPGHLSGTVSPRDNSSGGHSSGRVSGTVTPLGGRQKRPKWYESPSTAHSTTSLSKLTEDIHGTTVATAASAPHAGEDAQSHRPSMSRAASSGRLESTLHAMRHPIDHIRRLSASSTTWQLDSQTMTIADRLASQEYLLMMCRALMRLGAPTHRLEEYMIMAARKLCIQGSFQYLPNCMIVSFDDPITHTTELKLVKEPPAVDLGKLKDIQEVYKDVIHDKYSIQEAMDDIQQILAKPKKFGTLTLIFLYGLAAVSVGPFAFNSRPLDFPIAFLLGSVLGSLQLLLTPRSSQFSHVFEVAGTFVTSLAARGFGSILNSRGVPIFCFSALAQSSIALILPGWIILSAALELQSRNIIAGSIRMVYAIIYTLFLGFGILIGTTVMGLMYPAATNDITCHMPDYWNVNSPSEGWKLIYTKFIWVPIFTLCLAMINQAKWKQTPWMLAISFVGYQVNYWSGQKLSQNIQVANALGAFAVGTLANLYSRFWHGVAAAAMLPAIFVMVPSGLAASGSLVAGLTSANQITHNVTGVSIINNGTQGFYDAQNASASSSSSSGNVYSGTIFNVGYGMVQVAIGISVGLFMSALVIYPLGKRRSGLFTL